MNPGNLLPSGNTPDLPPVSPPRAPEGFSIDERSRLATIPGDVSIAEASRRLAESGFRLPIAGDQGRLSVSSWLAAGAPGAPDPWLDPVDHLLAGARARLASGALVSIAPSPRRAVGPDLLSLFVGSGERMGEIASADVRVVANGDEPARPLPYAGPRAAPVSDGERSLLAEVEKAVRAVR